VTSLGKTLCFLVVAASFYLAGIYAERHAPTYDTTPAVDHCPKEAP
jgi:uncharacterized membrane protein (DUF485 family)